MNTAVMQIDDTDLHQVEFQLAYAIAVAQNNASDPIPDDVSQALSTHGDDFTSALIEQIFEGEQSEGVGDVVRRLEIERDCIARTIALLNDPERLARVRAMVRADDELSELLDDTEGI
jgi:hypothetical protein